MKKVMIFLDRDGTIVYDNKYHLGRQKDWKKKIRFMKGVVSGIKLLNKKLPKAKVYLISNQPGVAIKDFPLLTRKRANEVFKEIVRRLAKKGIKIKGFYLCGHASPDYVKRHPQYKFYKKLADKNCKCMKPNPGMLLSALRKEKLKAKDARIYMIGDRASDAKTVLKLEGTGIVVPFKNEPGEGAKARKIKSKKRYIVKDFMQATKIIIKKEKSL